MAGELGVNVQLARRAGLLHDIGKALDHEIEEATCRSASTSAKIPREPAGHPRYRGPPRRRGAQDHLAFIIMAADAISAARPGARRENMESYIKRLETLEALCNGFEGCRKLLRCPGWPRGPHPGPAGQGQRRSGHPAGTQCRQKIENELDYPGQIKVSVIRESRATEYANNFRSLGCFLLFGPLWVGDSRLQRQRGSRKRSRQRGEALPLSKVLNSAAFLPPSLLGPLLTRKPFHISILHISPLRFIINKNTVI